VTRFSPAVAQKVGMRYMRRIGAQHNGGRQSDGKKKKIKKKNIYRLYCILYVAAVVRF